MADVQKLQTEITKLGLWNAHGDDGRFRYRYQLIPGQFVLTAELKQQLGDIARLTTGLLQASTALTRWLGGKHQQAIMPKGVPLTPPEAAFFKMLKAACGGYQFPVEQEVLPPIVKVDLAWDGQQLQVLEVDTYNPRGMAYALWLRYVHAQTGEAGMGHTDLLATLQKQLAPGETLVWLYSERERYYAPVLEAFAAVVATAGIKVRVVAESALPTCVTSDIGNFLAPHEKLLIVPDRMHVRVSERNALVAFALREPDRVVMPFVPHLGCKGLLAFATNGGEHNEVAAWQQRFLAADTSDLARQYIPSALLLGRAFGTVRTLPTAFAAGGAVLKAINSSGAKGVYMPSDTAYDEVLASARTQKTPNYIAQRVIEQQPMTLLGQAGPEQHLVRITTYVDTVNERCLDAELTGTGTDPLVHGGTGCVQLPAVF